MKNKIKLTLFFIAVLLVQNSKAQFIFELDGIVQESFKTDMPKAKIAPGTNVVLNEIFLSVGNIRYKVTIDGIKYEISKRDLKKINFDNQNTIDKVWTKALVLDSEVYEKMRTEGMNYDIRADLDKESIDFIKEYEKFDLFFEDIYLEEYLQSLLPNIHVVTLSDNRPGNLSIKVVKNYNPDAFILPNGTIMISIGLLSIIDSEEELVSILAHEVAHFVLDHYVMNILKQQEREKRAAFWAGFATALAAAGDVYMSSQNSNYQPGLLTVGTAAIAFSAAAIAVERLGLKYSKEQEKEAHTVATKVLKKLNISNTAYATVSFKLKEYAKSIGMNLHGTNYSLITRIYAIGAEDLEHYKDENYYITISNASTLTAEIEFANQHFTSSDRIISRNIDAGIACEEDFILKARLIRNLYNDQKNMQIALGFLTEAESLNVYPTIDLYRDKGLTLTRLGKHIDAKEYFKKYLNELENFNSNLQWVKAEKRWTNKMIYKCEKL